MMASRKAENEILERNGYLQGRDGDAEATQCASCGNRVSGRRSWWLRNPYDNEAECYCRACSMFWARVHERLCEEFNELKREFHDELKNEATGLESGR
jgi:hypothetical protein